MNLAVASAVSVPIISGVVQVLKNSFKIPTRFVPLTSVLVGIATGLILMGLGWIGGIVGVILGLSACGLYDLKKKTISGNIS